MSLPLQPHLRKTTPRKRAEQRKCKVLEKNAKKIWKFQKLALPLQSVRVTFEAKGFQTGSLIYWYILREKGM